MNNEDLPEPSPDDIYERCVRAEHSQHIEYWYVGDNEHDVIAGAEKLLYRHTHPYRYTATRIGGYAWGLAVSLGMAVTGMPSPEVLEKTPPLSE